MQPRQTLGRQNRLKSRKAIERLFREGQSFVTGSCKVYYFSQLQQDGAFAPPLQVAFGVSSRNFKKAVDRNRIKRLLRETFRQQQSALRQQLITRQHQLELFILYIEKELPTYTPLYGHMARLFTQLQKRIHESPPPLA